MLMTEQNMAKGLFTPVLLKPMAIAALMLLNLLVVGCSTTHQAISDPDFAPIRPVNIMPLPISDGAIYKAGYSVSLFEDTKAHRVGDIITIILQEKTNASKSANTTTTKDSEVSISAPTIFGRGVGFRGDGAILSASLDAERDFSGTGDSTQSNSLSGRISVTVAEVLRNGNLIVRGEKLLTLNQGSEHVRVSGIVRATDISPNNTVLSSQLANARFVYGGQGVIAEANTKGWLQRALDSNWWPF
jgi:flagellar L-ring protein precursor FlgH